MEGMFWDITLATFAAAAQVLTAYLGWRVTVDGVRKKKQHGRFSRVQFPSYGPKYGSGQALP